MTKMLIATVLLLMTCGSLPTQGNSYWCANLCLITEHCCYSDLGTQTNCCPYQHGTCCLDGWYCCPVGFSCTEFDTCVNTTDHTYVLAQTLTRPGARRELHKSRFGLRKPL